MTSNEAYYNRFLHKMEEKYFKPQNNNLTIVRFILASSVIFTHCYWQITGIADQDPFSPIVYKPLSAYAVDGFFFLSGFLVYASLQKRTAADFLKARLARMWPALFLSISGTILVGFFVTQALPQEYFSGPTLRFLFSNLSFINPSYHLTGVYCGEDLCNVNGSLWTLPWEMRFYLLLTLCSLLGLASPRAMKRFILPATLAFVIGWRIPIVQTMVSDQVGKGILFYLTTFDRLWPLFALGISAYIFRDKIRLSWLVLLLAFAANLAALHWNIDAHIDSLFIAYAILCFGFLSAKNGAVSGKWPDYSYGLYIYAFPVMVGIYALWPTDDLLLLTAANFGVTLIMATISWHCVEKPVLDRRRLPVRASSAAPATASRP